MSVPDGIEAAEVPNSDPAPDAERWFCSRCNQKFDCPHPALPPRAAMVARSSDVRTARAPVWCIPRHAPRVRRGGGEASRKHAPPVR
eukprot:gene5530-7559_t